MTMNRSLARFVPGACRASGLLIALIASAVSGCASTARAGQLHMMAGGVNINVGVTSAKERKFQTVLQQRYDYSCGSAALASLLTYHYNDSVRELEVFDAMYAHGDQAKIAQEGFSLLDMKRYLERRGYSSDGFRVSLDKLIDNDVPAIVLLDRKGYLHFVIIKGVTADQVLVGDPALGVRIFERTEFEQMWNGILFVVRSHRDLARQSFNRDEEWRLWVKAPIGESLPTPSLASFTLLRPPRPDF